MFLATQTHGVNVNPSIVVGLTFGDETKGRTIDERARACSGRVLVVRHSGGSQALHNVESPSGIYHAFMQFGAASLRPGVRTALSRFMSIDLDRLEAEADVLADRVGSDPRRGIFIDPRCTLITPMHIHVGQAREIMNRRGSCGLGVGEAVRDAEIGLVIRVEDLLDIASGYAKLETLYARKREQLTALAESANNPEVTRVLRAFCDHVDLEAMFIRYRRLIEKVRVRKTEDLIKDVMQTGETVLFEGAQGALLDRTRGFLPYVTQTNPTADNARTLLREAGVEHGEQVIGVMRAYGHRHGAGPFVSEDPDTAKQFRDLRNTDNQWQGPFRTGWIDFPALRYGIRLNGKVDALALSCLDQLSGLGTIYMCIAYEHPQYGTLFDIPDLPADERTRFMFECKPVWADIKGWKKPLDNVRRPRELPLNARVYLEYIRQELKEIPIRIIGVGPRSNQTIYL